MRPYPAVCSDEWKQTVNVSALQLGKFPVFKNISDDLMFILQLIKDVRSCRIRSALALAGFRVRYIHVLQAHRLFL